MTWRRRSLLVLTASATLALVLANAPAQAFSPGASDGSRYASRSAAAARTRLKCTSGEQGSSGVRHCFRFTVEPFSAGSLTSADRTRRSAALAEINAAAGTGNTRQITAMPLRQAAGSAATLSAPPAQCRFDLGSGYSPSPDRVTSCSDQEGIFTDYTCDTSGNCTPSGDFTFEDQQWLSFSMSSSTWDHGMITLSYTGTGDLEAGFSAIIQSGCWGMTGECNAVSLTSPDPQTVQIDPYTTYNFEWTESDDWASATQAGQSNGLGAEAVLGVSWQLADYSDSAWDGELSGRCDSIATSTDGCVNDLYTPTLQLSRSQYGASADMISWAQQNLSGHWGLQGTGQPLHYLSDSVVQADNRGVICGASVFTADQAITNALQPYGDQDSCDEFPFASTYESGAMPDDVYQRPKPYVTSGADCAQVTAVQTGTSGAREAPDWSVTQVSRSPSGTEPCVRGHIPLKLNTGVGGAYGNLIQQNRMINTDAFWVQVTP